MLPSTTRRGSPTRRCYRTSSARPRPSSCAAPLTRFKSLGIRVERILSDNGACYRSRALALSCSELGIRRHLFTRPYRPRTNGKAERFIQTLANRWAYGAIYGSSAERIAALPGWLTHYNYTRRHGALSHKPPATRLREPTNLAGNYTR